MAAHRGIRRGGAHPHRRDQSLGNLSSGVRSIAIHPNDPNSVVLATVDRGVLRTSNGGAVWRPDNEGLADTHIVGVALGGPTLKTFAASQRSGVFVRRDPAWQALPHVGEVAAVRAVAFDPVVPARAFAGSRLTTDFLTWPRLAQVLGRVRCSMRHWVSGVWGAALMGARAGAS